MKPKEIITFLLEPPRKIKESSYLKEYYLSKLINVIQTGILLLFLIAETIYLEILSHHLKVVSLHHSIVQK
jgi:hypothetical protein